MVWDKVETDKFLKKLYKELKSEKVTIKFKKMRFHNGYILWPNKHEISTTSEVEIHLDWRSDLISTLVHEMLHRLYPSWTERMVLEIEWKIINLLSERQVRNIIKKFAAQL